MLTVMSGFPISPWPQSDSALETRQVIWVGSPSRYDERVRFISALRMKALVRAVQMKRTCFPVPFRVREQIDPLQRFSRYTST
jgi:hypothetical protein